MSRLLPGFGCFLAGLSVLLAPAAASAFCRATTCDPSKSDCRADADGCFTQGYRVFWGSDCISVSIQADGAPRAGVDYASARASVERAFEAWTGVDCPGGGHPSIHVEITDPVQCDASEYNSDKRNANVISFRDDSWPYESESPDTLGYTRINFDTDSGALFDVDIELNATAEPLAVGRKPKSNEADLDSIVTHEVGHFLGLNHSLNVEATMVAGYQTGSYELRTPSADDIAGICEIYPPDRMPTSLSCQPRHGFSGLCAAEQSASDPPEPLDTGMAGASGDDDTKTSKGCSVAAAPRSNGTTASLALLGALALLRRRKQS